MGRMGYARLIDRVGGCMPEEKRERVRGWKMQGLKAKGMEEEG